MTRDEIMNMPAGAEMDALISSEIFGVMAFRGTGHWEFTNERDYLDEGEAYYLGEYQEIIRLPKYSTDMGAAWKVVERFENRCMLNNVHGIWECYLPENAKGESKFAPLAICRAALLAVSNGS